MEPSSDVNKTYSDSCELVDVILDHQKSRVSGGQFQQLGYCSNPSLRQSGILGQKKALAVTKTKNNYLAYNQQRLSQKIIQKQSNMRQSPIAWSGSLSNSNFQTTHSIHKHLNIHQLQQSYGSLAGLSKLTADEKTQITTAETAMSSAGAAAALKGSFNRTQKINNTKSM
jgi:hypothetical protein